jgi:hypothetical protein
MSSLLLQLIVALITLGCVAAVMAWMARRK